MNLSKQELDFAVIPEGKVVFLGSNPSCTSPYNDPFSHCKSANKMLSEWIPALGLTRAQVYFANVANYKTPRNRPLKKSEVTAEIPRLAVQLNGKIVVALGKTAQETMSRLIESGLVPSNQRDRVIYMPHPSGLNRQLNDKAWVASQLEAAKLRIAALINSQQPC